MMFGAKKIANFMAGPPSSANSNDNDPSFNTPSPPVPLSCPPLLCHHPQALPRHPPLPVLGPPGWPQMRPGRTPCEPVWQSTRHPRGRCRAGSCLTPSMAPRTAAKNSSSCSLPCGCHHSHVYVGATTPAVRTTPGGSGGGTS